MHATKAAVEEGIVPGGGVALLRASKVAREPASSTATSRSASTSSRGRSRSRCAGSRPTPATKGRSWCSASRRWTGDEGFNAQTEQYENLVRGRRDRSDQGGALGAAERRVDRVAAADDRSGHLADSRKAPGGRRRRPEAWAACTAGCTANTSGDLSLRSVCSGGQRLRGDGRPVIRQSIRVQSRRVRCRAWAAVLDGSLVDVLIPRRQAAGAVFAIRIPVARAHDRRSAKAMAPPIATMGTQIRNRRRTRCSCMRPRAIQAAQRTSNSASGTTVATGWDAAVTGS